MANNVKDIKQVQKCHEQMSGCLVSDSQKANRVLDL